MGFQSVIQTARIVGVSLLSIGLAHLAKPTIASAQVCNVYGCSQSGAGACNVYGCPNVGADPCNVYGCPVAPPSNNPSNNPSNRPTSAQASRSFQVVNRSGSEFYYFYASPAGQGSWSDDLLGDNTLPNGQGWNLTLTRSCQYDFQAETYSGSTMTWRNIDVCDGNSVNLNP